MQIAETFEEMAATLSGIAERRRKAGERVEAAAVTRAVGYLQQAWRLVEGVIAEGEEQRTLEEIEPPPPVDDGDQSPRMISRERRAR